MAKIQIRNMGAIREYSAEIGADNFCVFTGPQASGKSTIAKCIYYFRSAKEVILEAIDEFYEEGDWLFEFCNANSLQGYVLSKLRARFMELFGTSKSMAKDLFLRYEYNDNTFFEIKLRDLHFHDSDVPFENYISINLSKNIYNDFIDEAIAQDTNLKQLKKALDDLLDDDYEPYIITAGRCVLSLLSSQLKYLFYKMDDRQKSRMDYSTRKLIEYISVLKDQMDEGLESMMRSYIQEQDITHLRKSEKEPDIILTSLREMSSLSEKIIRGKYKVVGGEERIYISSDDDKYVKINYASSGQQEALWIINVLFHLIASRKKAFIVIEEPESHLFPDAQRLITEFIAMVSNLGCQVLITTHSPYVLGAINNLKYASHLSEDYPEISDRVKDIIPELKMLKNISAFYVDGDNCNEIKNCIDDSDAGLIDNGVIEGASEKIHDDYMSLFELYFDSEEVED